MSLLQTLRALYKEGMKFGPNELGGVDFCAVSMLGAKLPHYEEALYGSLVSPAGGGKTELTRPYNDWENMSLSTNDVTANAICSGSPTTTNLLINRLHRRLWILPDLTQALQFPEQKRDQFFGTLRGIFDRTYSKNSGVDSGNHESLQSRVTILGCVTEAIYPYLEGDVVMGQRFVLYRLIRKNDRAKIRDTCMSLMNRGDTQHVFVEAVKSALQTGFASLRNQYKSNSPFTSRPKRWNESDTDYAQRLKLEEQELLSGWSDFAFPRVEWTRPLWGSLAAMCMSVARIRSGKTKAELTTDKEELPYRILKQVDVYARCRALLDGRLSVNEDDLKFSKILAKDSIAPKRVQFIQVLNKKSSGSAKGASVYDLVLDTGLPERTVQNLLTHYSHNEVVDCNNTNTLYWLSEEIKQDFEEANFFEEPHD